MAGSLPWTVLGTDSENRPLLHVRPVKGSESAGQIVVLTGPERAAPVLGGAQLPGQMTQEGDSVSDQHGTWILAGDGGLWLYQTGIGFRKVAQIPLPPRPTPEGDGVPGVIPVLGGGCL
jgi:hypothetical protein